MAGDSTCDGTISSRLRLSGMVRRIDKSVEVWNVEDRASLEKTVAGLKA